MKHVKISHMLITMATACTLSSVAFSAETLVKPLGHSTEVTLGVAPQFDVLGEGKGNINLGIEKLVAGNLVGVGIEVGAKYGEHLHMDPNAPMADAAPMDMPYKFIGIPAVVRVTIHPFSLKDNVDAYAGVGAGYVKYTSVDKIERDKLAAQGDPWDHDGHSILTAHAGFKYYFCEKLGIFSEYSSAVSLVDPAKPLDGVEGNGAFGLITLGAAYLF